MPIFRRQDEAPRDRTPEERERARAERAARRAGRGGLPAGEQDLPAVPAPFEEPAHAEPEPAEAHYAEPAHPWADPDPDPVADAHPDPVGDALEEQSLDPEPADEHGDAHDDFGFEAPPPREPEPAPEPAPEPDPEPQPEAAFEPEPEPEPAFEPEPEPGSEPEREPAPPAPRRIFGPAAGAFPEPPPPAGAYPAPPPPEPEPEPAEEPEASALQPTAPFDPLADQVDEPEPEHDAEYEPEPEPEYDPSPIVPPAVRRVRTGQTGEERPVPPKRVSARERRLPPTPPSPGTPAFSQRRRRRGRILAALALLVVLALAFAVNAVFEPFKGEGGETVTVRIPPNSSIATVGDLLAENEIVSSATLFKLRARLAGAELKAGTFELRKDSSYGDALAALDEDPAAPRTVRVVIPEGRSRSETAPLVREAGLRGNYVAASRSSRGFNPRKYGTPRRTETLEGFLFPASYELSPGAGAAKLVEQQLAAFEENIDEVDMRRARRRNLTVYDVLIIASMVEREATLARERPIIAAVIHNRLRQGMPLGIDATIRFAVRNWSEPLKESELAVDSPFNTRKNTGLPPTPIGSPGLESIKAAANPANVDYLFYVVKPNGDGAHNFSSTDAEFQRDVNAYNEERERRGGQSPADSG